MTDADAPTPHDHLRTTDLEPLVETYGELHLDPSDDLFQRLVVSVVNQLISTEAAKTIRGRLFDRFEVTPAGILAADADALREVGLSGQKVEYVKNVARWFDEQDVTRDRFTDMTDSEVVADLTEITGIGDWTAEMFLMFGLGREDVFPVGDLAVRRGMEQLFGEMTRGEMRTRAEPWAPYRSYAALYIWQHYTDGDADIDGIEF
ncbi:DNA-3-methyladenine glycosylase II [Halogranum gelatinilyticum]|uniref:DNA-3-methyladenine glycosylase II n=1 Tax=Halogranum gelatinilyticum TaxID=660521 RepID=A0A1G9SU57_9EURY|nr:DNA-3-methyladenine glycosylase 2 family protein [Halogranum gelatinilyticum]SDM38960.1 DNA-3-methyladenine glycosylase II [Halogranum gelatinilyticum]